MKIEIHREDLIEANIELTRSLVTEALLFSDEAMRAKKLFLAYKNLEKVLDTLGVNLQE